MKNTILLWLVIADDDSCSYFMSFDLAKAMKFANLQPERSLKILPENIQLSLKTFPPILQIQFSHKIP